MGIFLTIFSFISLFVRSLVGLRRTVVHPFKLEIEQFTSSHPYNPRRHHCHTLRDINERWRSKYLRRHDVLSHIFFCPLRLLFFLGSLVLLNGAEQINGFCVRARPKKTKLQQTHAKPFNLWTHNYSHNGNIIRGDATSSFPKNFLFKKGKNIFLALSLPWWGWDWGTGPENERRNTSIRIQFGGGFIFSFGRSWEDFFSFREGDAPFRVRNFLGVCKP